MSHALENSVGMRFIAVPGTGIALGSCPVRVRDWRASGRRYYAPTTFVDEGPDHPAVNISWDDACLFCDWLSKAEGRRYRLPSDHEWSCAVGIGHLEDPDLTPEEKGHNLPGLFPWGAQWPPLPRSGNYLGEEWRGRAAARRQLSRETLHYRPGTTDADLERTIRDDTFVVLDGYRDDYLFTAPVGSFAPNALGFFDLSGNVNEWCSDLFSPTGPARRRVLRGGSFGKLQPRQLLASMRYSHHANRRYPSHGFRVALEM